MAILTKGGRTSIPSDNNLKNIALVSNLVSLRGYYVGQDAMVLFDEMENKTEVAFPWQDLSCAKDFESRDHCRINRQKDGGKEQLVPNKRRVTWQV